MTSCETAEQAWEACQAGPYDLALVDSILPGMGGPELCRRIRGLPWGDQVVILMVIGRDHPEGLREVLDAGADDCVTEPINLEFLNLRLTIAERRLHSRRERKRGEETLRQLDKLQHLKDRVLELLNRRETEIDTIREVVSLVKETTGFEAVGIRLREGEDFPYYETKGFSAHFVEAERYLCSRDQAGELVRDCEGNPYLECMCGNVISGRIDASLPWFSKGGSFWTNSTTAFLASINEEDLQDRTRNRCNEAGYETVVLVPLGCGEESVGLLQLNDSREGMASLELIEFLEGLTPSVGICLAQNRAEEEARLQSSFLHGVLDSLTNPLYVIDVETYGIILANPAAGTLPASGEVCCYALTHGRSEPCTGYDHPCPLQEVKRTGRPTVVEHVHCVGDTPRIVEIHGQPLFDADRQLRYLIEFCLDVTDRKRAEEALQESQERFALATHAAKVGVWDWNAQTGVVYIDPTVKAILGYSDEEIPNDPDVWISHIHPDDRQSIWEAAQAHLEGRTPEFLCEHRMTHKDGSIRWALVHGQAMRDTQGNVVRMVGTDTDITERKRSEQALQRAHDELELRVEERTAELRKLKEFSEGILQSMTEGVVLIGSDERFEYVNPAAAAMVGYEPGELVGRSSRCILPDDQIPLVEAADEQRMSGVSDRYELEFLHRDGNRIPALISGTPRFEEGRFAGTLSVITNLGERKQSEAERMLLSTAVEQASEAVVITDTEANILYVNPAFQSMTGYSQEHAIGKNAGILKSGKHDAAFYRELWATILAGKVWTGEFVNRRADGTVYHEAAGIFPIRDEAGKITNFVALKRDVTDEVILAKRSQHARQMEAIGQFVSGFAHDFNNLAMIIMGTIDLLKRRPPADVAGEHLDVISHAIEDAGQLSRSLLASSRQQVMTPTDVDLDELVVGAIRMLRRLLPEDVFLRHIQGDCPTHVHCDQAMMHQVLLNLCANSNDAMPAGGTITIEVGNIVIDETYVRDHPWAREGRYVFVSVADTGVGMDEETRAQVLNPFFTTKKSGRGTGLGLASAYSTAKQHGGMIDVLSEPGVGTTVIVYLPAVEARAPIQRVLEVEKAPSGGQETVLVVEDHGDLRAVMVGLLESLGYGVLAAADGEEALETVRNETGDVELVITDMTMPKMGGVDLYHRARELVPDLRFLFCSGNTRVWENLGCEGDPRAAYLQKPFEIDVLATNVRELLDRD